MTKKLTHEEFDKEVLRALDEQETGQREVAMQRLIETMKAKVGIRPPEMTGKPIPRV